LHEWKYSKEVGDSWQSWIFMGESTTNFLMENLQPPLPFLPERISSAALRALVKSEGLSSAESCNAMKLIMAEKDLLRGWIAEALQTGGSLKLIADTTKVIPYLGSKKWQFRSVCRIQLGEALLGYIGNDDYLGFSLVA
jgi:hypothetical protein